MKTSLGRTQIAILRTVSNGEIFVAAKPSQYSACMRLVSRGLLDRCLGLHEGTKFKGNAKGRAFIIEHDDAIARRVGDG